MRILVLYTRLAGYFIECLKEFVKQNPEAEILCIAYPSSNDAPFKYPKIERFDILVKNSNPGSSQHQIVLNFNPTAIYVAGWADPFYNNLIKTFKGDIPIIVGMDNPWKGNLRQRIGTLYGQMVISKLFTRIWVAGIFQYEFARRLGFNQNQIRLGQYCGNSNSFSFTNDNRERIILFVGRLVDYKRPDWLVQAFQEICEEYPALNNWKVRIIGNGPLKESLINRTISDEKIQIMDFVFPEELPGEFGKAKIFCLPSSQEHWGVVVHEAAISGLPLLLSDNCGAATEFLISNYNGKMFDNNSFASFKNSLKALMQCTDSELNQMSVNSYELSKRITLDSWCATFKELVSSDI
jgi:glycosyltransferase involved in cell wall biosynthesis